jgi:hypothetical protein
LNEKGIVKDVTSLMVLVPQVFYVIRFYYLWGLEWVFRGYFDVNLKGAALVACVFLQIIRGE